MNGGVVKFGFQFFLALSLLVSSVHAQASNQFASEYEYQLTRELIKANEKYETVVDIWDDQHVIDNVISQGQRVAEMTALMETISQHPPANPQRHWITYSRKAKQYDRS